MLGRNGEEEITWAARQGWAELAAQGRGSAEVVTAAPAGTGILQLRLPGSAGFYLVAGGTGRSFGPASPGARSDVLLSQPHGPGEVL